jgi:hypothetical protein
MNRYEGVFSLLTGLAVAGSLAGMGCRGEVPLAGEPQSGSRMGPGDGADATSATRTGDGGTPTGSAGTSAATTSDPGAMSTTPGGGRAPGDSDGASPSDAWPDFDLVPPPAGLAGFAFIVNGVPQNPMVCPSADWEFPLPPGEGAPSPTFPPIPGVESALIVNTGTLPMAYLVQSLWNGFSHYVPGVPTGDGHQLAGVLDPGAQLDITSVYTGGAVALLGSAEPFSSPDAGKYVSDEGTIPWPAGVSGSGGAATMYIAEIEVPAERALGDSSSQSSCTAVDQYW